MEEAEQGADCCALPSAVRPEEAEEFALLDLKVQRLQRLDLTVFPVVLGERPRLNRKVRIGGHVPIVPIPSALVADFDRVAGERVDSSWHSEG